MGVGVDIMAISKISDSLNIGETAYNSFINKVFTENEINEAGKRPDKQTYFASRFAAKEAVFKSLGIGGFKISLKDLEILCDDNGCPYVNLRGDIKKIAETKNIRKVEISLSHDDVYVIAFALSL